jgi:hypothetical protein
MLVRGNGRFFTAEGRFTSDKMVSEGRPYLHRLSDLDTSLPGTCGEYYPSGTVSGLISAPDCHFSLVSDRPVFRVFGGSLTGNRAIGPVCLSGDFASEKTGLFRACFNRGSGGGMRFGLWRGAIRGPAVAMVGLAGFGVLRRRIGAI